MHKFGDTREHIAHSVDRERRLRPIVNTESGDHEHALAVAERGSRAAWRCGGTVPLTVDLVSFTLGVRQDLGIRRDWLEGLALAQAWALQLDTVRAV